MSVTMTRRGWLSRSAAVGAAALAAPVLAPRSGFAAAAGDLWRLDATAQADLVRRGEVSALELVDAAIARIERFDPLLNAVVTRTFERAREAARGPLPQGPFRGVPYLVKDLNDVAGVRTTHGSRLFADNVAAATTPYVARALASGVIALGKSNTPEFGLIGTTESLALGVCRNPWNPDYSPGGSSGGAGAAVAAGLVPIAHATDGGGSIRIPASCCGLFGVKPSRGRLGPAETEGAVDLSVQHCVSRSVRDSAAMFAAAEYRGADAELAPVGLVTGPADRRLRIAFSSRTYTGAAPHPDVEVAAQRAAELCAQLGHQVEEAAPVVDGERFIDAFMTVWSSSAAAVLAEARNRGLDPDSVLEPWTLGLAVAFNARPAGEMAAAIAHFDAMARVYQAFLSRYDVVLTPTLSAPPVKIGAQAPTLPFAPLYEDVLDWVAYTPIHNAAGTAAMSVPLGWSAEGLPIGVQFATVRGGERTLFELAYELEAAAPWADRWPDMVS
ncbi:MAG: amidase [Pseudomonadales bacterium]